MGALAKLFMPGKAPGGVIFTTLTGIAGGVIAGFIGQMLGWYRTGFTAPGIATSILGAVLLLLAYRVITERRRTA